jgi:hypothetical protein
MHDDCLKMTAAVTAAFSASYILPLSRPDECRLQLVYAWGSPVELPHREERVAAVQALFRALSHLVDLGQCPELVREEVAVWLGSDDRWAASRQPRPTAAGL